MNQLSTLENHSHPHELGLFFASNIFHIVLSCRMIMLVTLVAYSPFRLNKNLPTTFKKKKRKKEIPHLCNLVLTEKKLDLKN